MAWIRGLAMRIPSVMHGPASLTRRRLGTHCHCHSQPYQLFAYKYSWETNKTEPCYYYGRDSPEATSLLGEQFVLKGQALPRITFTDRKRTSF